MGRPLLAKLLSPGRGKFLGVSVVDALPLDDFFGRALHLRREKTYSFSSLSPSA